MPAPSHRVSASALLALALACAGTPTRPDPLSSDPVLLPPPPAAARLRLVKVLPDPAAPPPRRLWWRTARELITGAEQPAVERNALARPFGVAFAAGGIALVADADGGRVVRIDARGALEDLSCRGSPWAAPMAVALAPDGTPFVADAGAGVVVRWSEAGCRSLGAGILERPTGVAVTAERVWVADPPRHQVVALTLEGGLVHRLGERGEGDGRFHFPSALALEPAGTLLVVDALNFRIVRLDAEGRWLGAFGEPGESGAGLSRPKGVAVTLDGDVYVTDAQRDAVLVFGPEGSFRWAAGSTGAELGQFAHPAGIAVAGGRVAVADSQNRRVQIFELLGGST